MLSALFVVVADPQVGRAGGDERGGWAPERRRAAAGPRGSRPSPAWCAVPCGSWASSARTPRAPAPTRSALVGAVGAEALGVDRRGAGAERLAVVGAGIVHLLAGAVEAAAALPVAVVLDVAGVVDGGRAIALTGARISLGMSRLPAVPNRSAPAQLLRPMQAWAGIPQAGCGPCWPERPARQSRDKGSAPEHPAAAPTPLSIDALRPSHGRLDLARMRSAGPVGPAHQAAATLVLAVRLRSGDADVINDVLHGLVQRRFLSSLGHGGRRGDRRRAKCGQAWNEFAAGRDRRSRIPAP